MDEDLLDKYFAGQCTPEETERVKKWLDQPIANESSLLRNSWRNISIHIRTTNILAFTPWSRYLAAASVALLAMYGIGYKLTSSDFVIHNTSRNYEAFDNKGLQLRLPPQAAARINSGMTSQSADLVFCGNVRIENNSENDINMKLNLNCLDTDHPNFTTILKARKDKKYVAFQYRFKSEELVVVEEDRIFDLPLPLQQKALETLEI